LKCTRLLANYGVHPNRLKMTIYKVQLMRDGKPDGVEENMQAPTEKGAAEKIAGRILFKQGLSEKAYAFASGEINIL